MRAVGNGSSNDISWTASESRDVAGYNVESAPTATGPWSPLTGAPVTATGFSDATPIAVGPTFYRVTTSAGESTSAAAGPVSVVRSAPTASGSPADGAPLLVPESESVIEPEPEPELESVLFFGTELSLGSNSGLLFGVLDPTTADGVAGSTPAADGMTGGAGEESPTASESPSDGLLITGEPLSEADQDPSSATATPATNRTASSDMLWIGLVVAAALAVLSMTARWRLRHPPAPRRPR